MTALAATYGFTADKGATFIQSIVWLDPDNEPIDLSGYTASMVIREKTTASQVVLTLTIDNGRISFGGTAGGDEGDNGEIILNISAADMDIAAGQYTYTLEVVSGSGEVTRLLMGAFVVRPDTYRI